MPAVRTAYRYLAGRPLDGRADHPYFKPGAGRWPGWKRQILRVGAPAVAIASLLEPTYAEAGAPVVAVAVLHTARRRLVRRKFNRAYVAPTLAAIKQNLGLNDVRLFVDPTLGTLTPRLAKPLSPAEASVREFYGHRIEPVVRWPGEQMMRGVWAVQAAAAPVTSRIAAQVRRPGEKPGPRIELTVETPFLTSEQWMLSSAIITAKIPVSDLIEVRHQVGPRVSATWTVRKRPPTRVGIDEVLAALPGLAEYEFYLGAGPGSRPVVLSLHEDSPHMAVSAGSGAGKSVFAMLVAVQVLARAGRVVILDRKGSHRWALNLPGVDYCTKPAQMHAALIRLAELADERNTLALHEPEDWNPGERVLVICEELNATIGQLVNYWAVTRERGEPKKSPAVSAIADILFMGRSAKVNMLAIAQMLTARAIGGPEARENFGIRCLARYTTNAW